MSVPPKDVKSTRGILSGVEREKISKPHLALYMNDCRFSGFDVPGPEVSRGDEVLVYYTEKVVDGRTQYDLWGYRKITGADQ